MYPTPCSLSFPQEQPRPRFCIFRPGGLPAPLIPMDELPSWLHLGNFGADLITALQPVSLTYIPREGEYDVVCHNCSSSVDSLHQSQSDRNSDSQSPRSSASQSSGRAYFASAPDCDAPPVAQPVGIMGQPPVHATVPSPYLGMCMVQLPVISSNVMPSVLRSHAAMEKARDIASTCSHIGSDLFEKGVAQREQQSPASDADSERSAVPSQKTVVPPLAQRIDSPDPRAEQVSSPNSRTGFDPIAELESRLREAKLTDNDLETMTVLTNSIASTRSITAAVMRLEQLMAEGKIRRPANFDPAQLHRTGFKSDSVRRQRAPNLHVPSKRARVRRRRRRAEKPAKSKQDPPKANDKLKTEQPNSATKRRERREKLGRGKKDTGGPSRFAHMTAMQNGQEPPHR